MSQRPRTGGGPENFRTEEIVFDIADTSLPYNSILGQPALAKFMAVSHFAYNMMKIPAKRTNYAEMSPRGGGE